MEEMSLPFVLTVVLLAAAMLMIAGRLIAGPDPVDRIVALDLMATAAIGIIAVVSIYYNSTVFLDIAIAVALTSFLGTVAFAYYLQKRSEGE